MIKQVSERVPQAEPGSREPDPQAVPAASGFDPSREHHDDYGPCDGFGPMWTCSQCTRVIACDDGSFSAVEGGKLTLEEASARVGDYLLWRAELAATAAFGCCDNPADIADFVRRSLIMPLPGQPWRHRELFVQAGGTL